MLGIKYELIQKLSILIAGSLVISMLLGFSLLRFYDEFSKGLRDKSRLRLWYAFFTLSFPFVLFYFVVSLL